MKLPSKAVHPRRNDGDGRRRVLDCNVAASITTRRVNATTLRTWFSGREPGLHGAINGGSAMRERRNKLGHILIVGAVLATLSGALHARDPGINQPGIRGGTAGVGAPGVGIRDPGINQPGAAGNVGGVARRTTRRIVATSAVVATLPPNCTTVVIEGTTLQQCGGTYYQPSGNQYVVVNVE